MSHAYLAPSAANTWTKCYGYPKMAAQYPGKSSAASEEGVLAHTVASIMLMMGEDAAATVGGSEEMMDGARLYRDHIQKLIEVHGKPDLMKVEEKLAIVEVHPSKCFGTPDVWMYWKAKKRLFVGDYKFGHGFVDTYGNYQLISYALGAAREAQVMGPFTIDLTIIQPRCYHRDGPVRTWPISSQTLDGWAQILKRAADNAMGANPSLVAGDHCKYCPARHACPALHRAAMAAADYSEEAVSLELDDRQLGMELSWIRSAKKALDTRLAGLEEAALARIQSGKVIHGSRIEHTQGRLQWSIPADMVQALGAAQGIKLLKPAEPVTPTQAVKLGLDKAIVDSASERKPGKAELVPDEGAAKYFAVKV